MLKCRCGATSPTFSTLSDHISECRLRKNRGGKTWITFSLVSESEETTKPEDFFVGDSIVNLQEPEKEETRPKRSRKGPSHSMQEFESYLRLDGDVPDLLREAWTEERGRIVLAWRALKKGDFVAEYTGKLISRRRAEKREKRYNEKDGVGSFLLYFKHNSKQLCLDATKDDGRLGRLISHSRRHFNVKPIMHVMDGRPRIFMVATRDILRGEELFYDYNERRSSVIESFPWLKT